MREGNHADGAAGSHSHAQPLGQHDTFYRGFVEPHSDPSEHAHAFPNAHHAHHGERHAALPEHDFGRLEGGCGPAPAALHDGGGLGWGPEAWGEAGGFQAVLSGHTPDAMAGQHQMMSSAGGNQIVINIIEHLDINTTINQTTYVDNSQIVLNASNGGSIDVGGSVSAVSNQQALLDHSDASSSAMHFG